MAVYIKQNRARFITAALTALRAYALQPLPMNVAPLDSFEDWSWRVRDALIWLGEEDPVSSVNYDNDGSSEIAGTFQVMQTVANAKVRTMPAEFRASDLALWATGHYALRDALEQAGCGETNSAAKVGMWLRAHKNRIAGGFKLVSKMVDGGRQPNKWLLQSVEQRNDA